jgi:hypothetical protein
MILYLKSPQCSTKKNLLEIINSFGKAARYKINMQKSVTFLYSNNGGNNSIGNSSLPKKNKVPWDKFNKGNKRPFQ